LACDQRSLGRGHKWNILCESLQHCDNQRKVGLSWSIWLTACLKAGVDKLWGNQKVKGKFMNSGGLFRPNVRHRKSWNLKGLFGSIKGQIFVVFAAAFLSLVALTLLNFWSLSTVKARLFLGERYDDLLNNILEARRFEKNFILYQDVASLREGTVYLQKIDELVAELASDIIRVTDQRSLDKFLDTLKNYKHTIRTYKSNIDMPINDEEIRSRGKNLVDFAERLRTTKRQRIHKAIFQTSLLPFAFLGVCLVLMLLVIKLISLGLLRPLGVLQAMIQRAAKGDYRPTSYEGLHTDEISTLIGAFNSMAQEIEANQEHLLQARKIAALGTFTAGIAHELNNPINNIYLTAETYMEEFSGVMSTEAREMMRDILMQAERASDIVKNLLDFSRTERPAFNNLEAREIIDRTVALVKNQIMLAGIKLEITQPADLPQVHGNLRKLQQVFMNLLLNAIQAMPNGGTISIKVEAAPPEQVRFDIKDTGSGIRAQNLEHIFEPFFTTKSVGRGTGLGLAAAYSIVRSHGGHIEVESEVGVGTLFSVYLPIAVHEVEQSAGRCSPTGG